MLVTIIIPAYNVASHLPRCLDSVLNQTYRHLEVIVVDDGSTDGTPAVCADYASRDSRVKVINRANGGPSAARNAALDAMTGKWILCVDSDDYIPPYAVSTLLAVALSRGADVVAGDALVTDTLNHNNVRSEVCSCNVHTFTSQQALESIYYKRGINNSLWGRIFSARLFDGLRLKEGLIYEDLDIVPELYSRASKVVTLEMPVYYYISRKGSIMDTFTPQREQVLDVLDRHMAWAEADNSQLVPAVINRRLRASFNIFLLTPSTPDYDAMRQRCWNNVVADRSKCLFDKQSSAKLRFSVLASYVGKNTFYKLFNKSFKKNYRRVAHDPIKAL